MRQGYSKNMIECGTDEAGRGCLAGPVTAAAVILPKTFTNTDITDSKKLSHNKRNDLRKIIESEALAFSVAHISKFVIDEINILNASIKAMHEAISGLSMKPELILVDGNKFKPYGQIPHHCIVKGDQLYLSIAAASILAKSYRDELMQELHHAYPVYCWNENKGYPTTKHRAAIATNGPSIHHRTSFKLV